MSATHGQASNPCRLAAALILIISSLTSVRAEDSPRYEGKVLDSDHRPVAGAVVEIYDLINRNEFPMLCRRVGRTVTDQDGAYSLVRQAEGSDVIQCFVVACGEPYELASRRCSTYGGIVEPLRLGRRPLTFAGHVIDSSGNPVSGAAVYAILEYDKSAEPVWPLALASTPWLRTESQADGSYHFDHLPYEARVNLTVKAAGYADTFAWDTDHQAGRTDVDVVLLRMAGLYGRVIDEQTGTPVPEARVFVGRMGQPRVPLVVWSDAYGTIVLPSAAPTTRELWTNASGLFAVAGVAPGEYSVFLDPFTNPDRSWVGRREFVTVHEGQAREVTLHAARPGILRLRLLTRDNAQPLRELNVKLEPVEAASATALHHPDNQQIVTQRTDDQGDVQYYLAPGQYQIVSVATPHYRLVEPRPVFSVVAGDQHSAHVLMEPSGRKPGWVGICVDSRGRPVVGSQLRLLPDAEPCAVSDENGQFQFLPDPGILADSRNEAFLVAEQPELGLAGIQMVDPDVAMARPIRVKLTPAKSIEGRVMNSAGHVLDNAIVSVYLGPGYIYVATGRSTPYQFFGECLPDTRGRFHMPGLPPSRTYHVFAEAEGFSQVRKIVEKIPDGRNLFGGPPQPSSPSRTDTVFRFDTRSPTVDTGDYLLKPNRLSIWGHVVDDMGHPLRGFTVYVRNGDQLPLKSEPTDARGYFVINGLAEGKVQIETFQDNTRSEIAWVQAGDEDVRIIFAARDRHDASRTDLDPNAPPSGLVELHIVDALTERPVRQACVDVPQQKGNRVFISVDEEGIARFRVAGGTYTLAIEQYPEYRKTHIPLTIEDGQVYRQTVKLRRKPCLTAKVLDPDGKPAIGATVRFFPDSMVKVVDLNGQSPPQTGGDGCFRVVLEMPVENDILPFVVISDPSRDLGCAAACGPDLTLPEVIQLQPTASVELVIKDWPDPAPLDASTLRIQMDDGYIDFPAKYLQGGPATRPRVDGLIPLPPGHTYSIGHHWTGATFIFDAATLESGQTYQIVYTFDPGKPNVQQGRHHVDLIPKDN